MDNVETWDKGVRKNLGAIPSVNSWKSTSTTTSSDTHALHLIHLLLSSWLKWSTIWEFFVFIATNRLGSESFGLESPSWKCVADFSRTWLFGEATQVCRIFGEICRISGQVCRIVPTQFRYNPIIPLWKLSGRLIFNRVHFCALSGCRLGPFAASHIVTLYFC